MFYLPYRNSISFYALFIYFIIHSDKIDCTTLINKSGRIIYTMKNPLIFPVYIAFFLLFCSTNIYAAEYYVSNSGNDNNNGTSPLTAWKTINKVNNSNLNPGDTVHFKKGDSWKEYLSPKSGSEKGHTTYTSYGTGSKPIFYGSITKSNISDWILEDKNIWRLKSYSDFSAVGYNKVDDSYLWTQSGAKASSNYSYTSDTYTIEVTDPGQKQNYIQFIFRNLKIDNGKTYALKFNIKATHSFEIENIALMENKQPWKKYYSNMSKFKKTVGTQWEEKVIYYKANTSSDKARITFYLGQVSKPQSQIYIKDLQFVEFDEETILCDIGNIIFNNGNSCGTKKFSKKDIKHQGDFYYDQLTNSLFLYSQFNPASYYIDIQCALTKHIINQTNKSYIIFDGLELKYGGAHGIFGDNTSNIIIRNCDINYIGGGFHSLNEKKKPVRYGNGIEFWGNAHDNLVENCNIYEIYDAGVTNQSNANNTYQYNIIYKNNNIWNCEYSYEYWSSGKNSHTSNIEFKYNKCYNAGFGWGHKQRPDPSGFHICFFNNNAKTEKIELFNNVFDTVNKNIIYVSSKWNDINQLNINNNELNCSSDSKLISNQDNRSGIKKNNKVKITKE